MTTFSGLFLYVVDVIYDFNPNFIWTLPVDVTHDLVILSVFTPRNNGEKNPPVMDIRI